MARTAKADPISRSARRWRRWPAPDSSQITTVEAPISMSESRPNPASATDRADMAAIARTTIPITFQHRVLYSRANPRRSRALRVLSSMAVMDLILLAAQVRSANAPLGPAAPIALPVTLVLLIVVFESVMSALLALAIRHHDIIRTLVVPE